MNMLAAAKETVAIIDLRLAEWTLDWGKIMALDHSLSQEHLHEMLLTMESGVNPQDTESGFSDGKMGRWLGWMQAAGVAMNALTLDECKTINMKWRD